MKVQVRRTTTATMKFGHNVDAGEIKDWLNTVPDNAKVSVDHWKGDQRDPAETTLSATWDVTP